MGLDVATGEAIDPVVAGIFDNYLVKKQILQGAPIVASQLLLVDEVMRAGASQLPLHSCSLQNLSLQISSFCSIGPLNRIQSFLE